MGALRDELHRLGCNEHLSTNVDQSVLISDLVPYSEHDRIVVMFLNLTALAGLLLVERLWLLQKCDKLAC